MDFQMWSVLGDISNIGHAKIKIAVIHLEGRALQWHQNFIKLKIQGVITWNAYKHT